MLACRAWVITRISWIALALHLAMGTMRSSRSQTKEANCPWALKRVDLYGCVFQYLEIIKKRLSQEMIHHLRPRVSTPSFIH